MNNAFQNNLNNTYVPPKITEQNGIISNMFIKTFSKLPSNSKKSN